MDRFIRGLVAGIAGGVIMNIWSFFAYYILNLPIKRYLDWAGVILYGHLPNNSAEIVFALIMQILWVGLLGIIFAFILSNITSRMYLVKAAFYGLITGFFIYAIPSLLGTPYLEKASTATVLSNHFGGLLWGLTMAWTLRRLDTTPRVKT